MTIRSDQIHNRLTPIEPAAERLPFWTRSTNPIVRRHLGLYWRTLPPELLPVLRILLGWSVLLLVGTLALDLLYFALIVLIVSLVVLPIATLWYGYILLDISMRAASMMQQEKRNNTLNLLMATPMSLEQILLGKVAAAFWRHMEDWTLICYAVVLTAPPAFFTLYSGVWQSKPYPLVLSIAVIGGTAVSLLRLVLEPLMIGMVAVFIGMVVPYRNTAISLSVALSGAYFLMLWLIAQLPAVKGGADIVANYPLSILVTFVLPVALPALITWGLLKLTVRVVRAD